jgi:hypothetical protein
MHLTTAVPARPTRLMMIRPRFFNVNKEAAPSNIFMRRRVIDDVDVIVDMAMHQHERLHSELESKNVSVLMFDNQNVEAPDAVFCNNWITVHHEHETFNGRKYILLYPMALHNRRIEVREDIVKSIADSYGAKHVHDLRIGSEGSALEGTGSMVLDRRNRIVYAALSPRTHLMKLLAFAGILQYEVVHFNTLVEQKPIYHTNVIMCIGEHGNWVIVCTSAIHPSQRDRVLGKLRESGRTLVEITEEQMKSYCGNVLEIVNNDGVHWTVMSDTARAAFTAEQLAIVGPNIISVPFDVLENYGGGGVRCCLAEI